MLSWMAENNMGITNYISARMYGRPENGRVWPLCWVDIVDVGELIMFITNKESRKASNMASLQDIKHTIIKAWQCFRILCPYQMY